MVESPSPRTLEKAADDALAVAIERTPAYRLALAWLPYAGVAEQWQVDGFWKLLGESMRTGSLGDYCRQRDFAIWLTAWRRVSGLRTRP